MKNRTIDLLKERILSMVPSYDDVAFGEWQFGYSCLCPLSHITKVNPVDADEGEVLYRLGALVHDDVTDGELHEAIEAYDQLAQCYQYGLSTIDRPMGTVPGPVAAHLFCAALEGVRHAKKEVA